MSLPTEEESFKINVELFVNKVVSSDNTSIDLENIKFSNGTIGDSDKPVNLQVGDFQVNNSALLNVDLDANGKKVKNTAEPTEASDCATKNYVDGIVESAIDNAIDFSKKTTHFGSVILVSFVNLLSGDVTSLSSSDNTLVVVTKDTLTLDGNKLDNFIGENILICGQNDTTDGVYTITSVSTSETTFTRVKNMEHNDVIGSVSVYVDFKHNGVVVNSTYANTTWVISATTESSLTEGIAVSATASGSLTQTITVGTDTPNWVLYKRNQDLSFGKGLELNNNVVSLKTPISVEYGGTNSSYLSSGVLTGDGLSLGVIPQPTGDLVGTTDNQILTNKIISSENNQINITKNNITDLNFASVSESGLTRFATTSEINEGNVTNAAITPNAMRNSAVFMPRSHSAIVGPANTHADYTSISAAFNDGHMDVFVRDGIYTETQDIIIPNRGKIEGENAGQVVIVLADKAGIYATGNKIITDQGSISIDTNTNIVTGEKTAFTQLDDGSPNTIKMILLANNFYQVSEIKDDTTLTLAKNYNGVSLKNKKYLLQEMYAGISLTNLVIYNYRNGVENPQNYPAVVLNAVTLCKFDFVTIRGYSPLVIKNSGDFTLSKVVISDSQEDGVLLNNCIEIGLESFNIYNCLGNGIKYVKSSNCKITISSITANLNGIYIDSESSINTITNTTIKYNKEKGVFGDKSNKIIVTSGSIIEDNGEEGLYLTGENNIVMGVYSSNGKDDVF